MPLAEMIGCEPVSHKVATHLENLANWKVVRKKFRGNEKSEKTKNDKCQKVYVWLT